MSVLLEEGGEAGHQNIVDPMKSQTTDDRRGGGWGGVHRNIIDPMKSQTTDDRRGGVEGGGKGHRNIIDPMKSQTTDDHCSHSHVAVSSRQILQYVIFTNQ